MQANGVKGTLRMIGTPAEEGGSGKVFMVRDGVFDDVDAVIAWHPASGNSSRPPRRWRTSRGSSASRPERARRRLSERGRSALDAVEIMNVMTNFLREHVPAETRIHYVITKGGAAPNVVPTTPSRTTTCVIPTARW
jgi:aminobenzoyl-glutamate utilization protein B